MVKVDFINYRPLITLVQIGKLHRRSHLDFALVHKVKKFRHKVCQANVAADLFTAFSDFISNRCYA